MYSYRPEASAYPYRPRRPRWPLFLMIGLVVLIAIVVIVFLLAWNGTFGSPAGHPFFGFWGGFLLLFLILWIAFFAVRMVFWSRAWGYRRGAGTYARPDPAVMIARRRYARGEITREQYDQMLSDLGRGRSPP